MSPVLDLLIIKWFVAVKNFQETTEYFCLLKTALTLMKLSYLLNCCTGFLAFLPAHPTVSSMSFTLCVLFMDIFPGPGTPFLNK